MGSICSGLMYPGVPTNPPARVTNVPRCDCSEIALASPKSIMRGTGLPSTSTTRMFVGFRVAMNNCFLMRVLHAFTYFCENKQALARRETLLVAVFGDGQALHILHGKVRLAFGRGTGVENLGDGGVIHHGKRLPLQIEAYQCGL